MLLRAGELTAGIRKITAFFQIRTDQKSYMMRRSLQQWVVVVFGVTTLMMTTTGNKPRLSPVDPLLKDQYYADKSAAIPRDVETHFYTQTLDHFNYAEGTSYNTFQQRYFLNYKWWGGAANNAPILVLFGAEGPIDADITSLGFLSETAPRLNALLVYIEHRFYGESNPYGVSNNGDPNSVEAMVESVNNGNTRGYFNSAQALADYAEILLYIKDQLHAHHSPVIVVGGSYGGMLASWFRLKYPHIAIGALASSAPVLYFDDITPQDGYDSVVSKDFQETSQSCYDTIKKSWDEIDRVASMQNGLAFLSQKFRTCSLLDNAVELKDYLKSMYSGAAQYNAPPNNPTAQICGAIDGASRNANMDILDRIFAGVVSYLPNQPCYNMVPSSSTQTQSSIGWRWQSCSEMLMPMGVTSDVSMFQRSPYDLQAEMERCRTKYGVPPRPHWATTYYGGHDIRLVLNKYGSNIIFSNGLQDPYSSAGVLEDISDTIVALKTAKGSHCLDLVSSRDTDPEWLVQQRNNEVKIMQTWLTNYYQDLR